MSKHVLVLNNVRTPLNMVKENSGVGTNEPMRMSGIFTELGVRNRNDRVYTKENFLPLVKEMQDRIANGAVYGELDHPDVFDITFQRTSHRIEKIQYNEETGIVEGQIRLMSTYWGKEAQAIVNDGCPIFVSSRAAGITDSNGYVTLKKLFTYDIVADPGFATARMNPACLNESMGINENADYAIFEFTNENQIQSLYNMNKNDNKTHEQLAEYNQYIENQIISLKEEIETLVKKGDNAGTLLNKVSELENLKEQNEILETYLGKLSDKVISLISTVETLNNKLQEKDQELNSIKEELNIVGKFAEHIAENTKSNKDELETVGKFVEYVAENAKSTKDELDTVSKFTEYIAENTKSNKDELETVGKFVEYVAEHTKNVNDSATYIKERLEIVGKFAEHIAEESTKQFEDQTKFIEYVAENTAETKVYENYLRRNVEGLINHAIDTTNKLNEAFKNNAVNENVISVESPMSFIEEDEEEENIIDNADDENASIENTEDSSIENTEDSSIENTDDITAVENTDEPITDEPNGEELNLGELGTEPDLGAETTTIEEVPSIDTIEEFPSTDLNGEENINSDELELTDNGDIENISDEEFSTDEPIITYGDGLVRITGTDMTGVVVSYDDNGVTIKLSDSDEEVTKSHQEIETIEDVEDNSDLLENVKNLIAEAKKRDASKITEPGFFKFLNESQIIAFKALSNEEQEKVIVVFNENECYTNSDAIRLISNTLSKTPLTLNEKLLSNMPSDVVSKWDTLNESQKASMLSQAQFCVITGQESINEFWNTRQFETVQPINEGNKIVTLENQEDILSQDYIDALNRAFDKL